MIDFTRHFPDNPLRGTGNPISETSPYLIELLPLKLFPFTGNGNSSGEATLSFCLYVSFLKGINSKGKNLLPQKQILSFKS